MESKDQQTVRREPEEAEQQSSSDSQQVSNENHPKAIDKGDGSGVEDQVNQAHQDDAADLSATQRGKHAYSINVILTSDAKLNSGIEMIIQKLQLEKKRVEDKLQAWINQRKGLDSRVQSQELSQCIQNAQVEIEQLTQSILWLQNITQQLNSGMHTCALFSIYPLKYAFAHMNFRLIKQS